MKAKPKESISQIADHLKGLFSEATVKVVKADKMSLTFKNAPNRNIEIAIIDSPPHQESAHKLVETMMIVRHKCLDSIQVEEFQQFINSENAGLRGVTVSYLPDQKNSRSLILKASFLGVDGESRDELDSAAINVQTLARFAALLDDRIKRSQVGGKFCYEMYHSQYGSKGGNYNRYINFARHVFTGSRERVFAQVLDQMHTTLNCQIVHSADSLARVTPNQTELEIVVRIPNEAPILTAYAPMYLTAGMSLSTVQSWISKLNTMVGSGHFELSADGATISYVNWKHLTDDLRFYSVDHLIASVREADSLITELTEDILFDPPTRTTAHSIDGRRTEYRRAA